LAQLLRALRRDLQGNAQPEEALAGVRAGWKPPGG